MKKKDIEILYQDYCDGKQKLLKVSRYYSLKSELREKIERDISTDNTIITSDKFKNFINENELFKRNINSIINYSIGTKNTNLLLYQIFRNPYLYVYIGGNMIFDFEKAEEITENLSLTKTTLEKSRQKAATVDFIRKHNTGNTFYVRENHLMRYLRSLSEKPISKLIKTQFLKSYEYENDSYYTTTYYDNIERTIANVVYNNNVRLFTEDDPKIFQNFISDYEEKHEIEFNQQQHECLYNMLINKFYLINGLPGVGKTTIIDAFCEYMYSVKNQKYIKICCPTGLAAKNIRDKLKNKNIQETVSTIHKFKYKCQYMEYNSEETPLDILIIDEASMIDTHLMYEIMCIVDEKNCSLILLGDTNQLPPISIGTPFDYFMKTKSVNSSFLNIIMRQNKSDLKDLINDMAMKKIEMDVNNYLNDKTIVFEDCDIHKDTIKQIIDKYKLNFRNSKFISPCHKKQSGVKTINTIIQSLDNGIYKGESIDNNYTGAKEYKYIYKNVEYKYKVDDVILCTHNFPKERNGRIFVNGDFCVITAIHINYKDETKSYFILQCMDDKTVHDFSLEDILDFFSLGFCCTIHKVQGSQYNKVVLFLKEESSFQWYGKDGIKLLYTAISRAKQQCIVVGKESFFQEILNNIKNVNDNINDITRIIEYIDEDFI